MMGFERRDGAETWFNRRRDEKEGISWQQQL